MLPFVIYTEFTNSVLTGILRFDIIYAYKYEHSSKKWRKK